MAHCPFEKLGDLEKILSTVRTWEEINEPRPGIFYIRRTPFLHFHIDPEENRWADVRQGVAWGPKLDLPIDAGPRTQQQFLKEVELRYQATRASLPTARKPHQPD